MRHVETAKERVDVDWRIHGIGSVTNVSSGAWRWQSGSSSPHLTASSEGIADEQAERRCRARKNASFHFRE